MAIAVPGQLNLDETPTWGSRSVDVYEKIEQIGEGTYGYGCFLFLFLVFFSYDVVVLLRRVQLKL